MGDILQQQHKVAPAGTWFPYLIVDLNDQLTLTRAVGFLSTHHVFVCPDVKAMTRPGDSSVGGEQNLSSASSGIA